MMSVEIPLLISAAGGEIVGKVRLQKMVYLLEQMGMGEDYSFDYHHYGPYSVDLTDVVDEEVFFDRVREDVRQRADGVAYSVFRVGPLAEVKPTRLGNFSFSQAFGALAAMQRRSATVLELAATIHWLAFVEEISDWRAELVRRKGIKAAHGRDREALELLQELDLAPA
jgi:uncharacterized protein YwgA